MAMIDEISFYNSQLIWPIVIGFVLLWILFVWKEWQSTKNLRFFLKILVAFAALLALTMIALRPMVSVETKTSSAALLTKGYDTARLDSLRTVYNNLKIISYQPNKPIGSALDSVSTLFVLGDGIKEFDFWQLDEVSADYLGDPSNHGITELKYDRQVTVGNDLMVQGRYENPVKGNHLILADPGGNAVDSIILKDNEVFKMSANIKTKGNYVYELLERDSLDALITREPLPISADDKTLLKVLVVNRFPTFETKYLKNYLAEMGHEVTVRSRLTKGKYKFEYFNTKRNPIYSFSQKQLEDYDLLIIDANSYLGLSKNVLRNLYEAISTDGLGLFVQPETKLFSTTSKNLGLRFQKTNSSETQIDGSPNLTLEKYPYSLVQDELLESVHTNNETILTAYRHFEKGRIGTTLLQSTYQLLLNGKTESYQRFWSEIVTGISKRAPQNCEWVGADQFAFQNEPYTIKFRTAIQAPELIASEEKQIPLMQDPDIRTVWSGVTFPNNIGWNRIELKNDTVSRLDFYVMDSTNWTALRNYRTFLKNRRHFEASSSSIMPHKSLSPLYQFWFFFIFLLGMGYLWLEPKFFTN